MLIVANHLRDHACSLEAETDVDLFGRSAFNRFYYACYWEIRNNLPNIVDDWSRLRHKALPDCLEGSVKKETLRTLERLRRTHIISDSDYGRLRPRITRSIAEIAQLLRQGYSIRRIADYEPNQKTTRNGTALLLDGRKLSTFESSYRQLAEQVGILRCCRDELRL